MGSNDDRREDAGYGSASLVGSDTSGLRSAREGREAVRQAREQAEHAPRDAGGADLGRLAGRGPEGASADPDAGTPGATSSATRASAGRRDADRDSRDGANGLQE